MLPTPPRLLVSPTVESHLADPDAISVLYSLLADPDVDYRLKFPLADFPYRSGTRALLDDSWHVVYSVEEDRSVKVHLMHRREEIDRLLGSG